MVQGAGFDQIKPRTHGGGAEDPDKEMEDNVGRLKQREIQSFYTTGLLFILIATFSDSYTLTSFLFLLLQI